LNISKLENLPYEDVIDQINTNYLGTINITKESIDYLKKTKGHILHFTSSSYTRGRAMYSLYSSCKAAIVNFVQAVAEEVYEYGMSINVMNPERTNTPMRVKNFGYEPIESLLTAKKAAIVTLNTLLIDITGQVIDIRKD